MPGVSSETIEFSKGATVLAGTIEKPEGEPIGAAVFAHCFTCTRTSLAAVTISRTLASHGIACLRFDFTGLGGSGGDFGESGFTCDVADVVAAVAAMRARVGGKILLVGHSLGGAAVLAAASELDEDAVAAVATIGAPADVPHVLRTIKGDLAAIEQSGSGPVSIGGRPFTIDRAFLERTRQADLLTKVAILRTPLMICHSPTDEVVGVENAGKLFATAIHPKSFLSLGPADHLLQDKAEARFAGNVIAAWAARYLGEQFL